MPDPDILTARQAITRFGVSEADLRRWRRTQQLTPIRTMRGWPRYLAAEIRHLARTEPPEHP